MSRIKQFINDITAYKRQRDDDFLNTYLNDKERAEFLKLRHAEVLHSIEVGKETLKELKKNVELNNTLKDEERKLFIKSSILHDIGKNKYPLSALKKTLAVFLGKIHDKREIYKGKSKILDIYINHPQYGYEILKNLNSFLNYEYLYDLVRYHSNFDYFKIGKSEKEISLFLIYKAVDDRC